MQSSKQKRENDQRLGRCSDLEFPLSQTSCLWICVRVADVCSERRAERKGRKLIIYNRCKKPNRMSNARKKVYTTTAENTSFMIFVADADTQNMQIKAPKGTVNVYIFRTINTTKWAGYALYTRSNGARASFSRNPKLSCFPEFTFRTRLILGSSTTVILLANASREWINRRLSAPIQ